MTQPVFRFAPSPNGWLHLGHACSALWNERRAQQAGGRLLLRLEDIDPQRCRPEYAAGIIEDMAWLGIHHEPDVLRQSAGMARYGEALAQLAAMGVTYRCACTRAGIAAAVRELGPDWPRDPDGVPHYPGTCRRRALPAGAETAIRLDVARALAQAGAEPLGWQEAGADPPRTVPAEPGLWGDVVLARKEVPTSYHLAVVVDDALQGVTHVVRGQDLFAATHVHVLLQRLLGLPTPRYHHHPLVLDGEGRKLAKSIGSRSLRALRGEGMTALDVRRQLGFSA
jgi:glutamyl-Q tRNA(Asp) synthetase